MLQLEREKNAQDRQVDTLKQQLHAETAKYAQLEKVASRQKAELIQLHDKNANFDREVNKLLTELKRSEWEVKQLESRQDKTIVEHVHVLEEAKRVTDRQLADAQKELESQAVYIRSLEKAKARLTNEVEDLARVTEKEHLVVRSNEKAARTQEALVKKAVLEAELERKNRQVSEANVRRLQEDLQATQNQVAEVTQQFLSMQQSKDELEVELARVADETNGSETLVKIQRQHQARISQIKTELQRELADVKDRLKVEIAAKNEESSTSPHRLRRSTPLMWSISLPLQIRGARFKLAWVTCRFPLLLRSQSYVRPRRLSDLRLICIGPSLKPLKLKRSRLLV